MSGQKLMGESFFFIVRLCDNTLLYIRKWEKCIVNRDIFPLKSVEYFCQLSIHIWMINKF